LAYRIILIIAVLFAAVGCPERTAPNSTPPPLQSIDVTLDGQSFHLELALDKAVRFQGLSDRPSIPVNGGMLFCFPKPKELQFVMRRCLVPIDIIFVGPGGRVVSMTTMHVQPPTTLEADLKRYPSGWPAQFAIELAGGTLDRINIKTGQALDLPLADLKRRAR